MDLGYTTCMGTSGSGVATVTPTTAESLKPTRLVLPLKTARTGCTGAGAGSTTRSSVGRRTASGSTRRTGTSTWASALQYPSGHDWQVVESWSAGGVVAEADAGAETEPS